MPPPLQCCAGGLPPSIPLARDLFRCYTIPKHKGGVHLNSISDLLKVSLGSFTLGKLLSAALTLAVCILAVRLLNKLAAKLLSRSKHLNDRLQRILLTALKAGLYIITGILTTNLVYQTPELLSRPYYINCDMSKYIALIIDTLNHDGSISALLNPNERIQHVLKKYANGEPI